MTHQRADTPSADAPYRRPFPVPTRSASIRSSATALPQSPLNATATES
jgi:hypothetical protein